MLSESSSCHVWFVARHCRDLDLDRVFGRTVSGIAASLLSSNLTFKNKAEISIFVFTVKVIILLSDYLTDCPFLEPQTIVGYTES